jgi:uncharacterized protein (TIGR03000 family)
MVCFRQKPARHGRQVEGDPAMFQQRTWVIALIVGALMALTAVPAEAARWRGGWRAGYDSGYYGGYSRNRGYNNYYGSRIGFGRRAYFGDNWTPSYAFATPSSGISQTSFYYSPSNAAPDNRAHIEVHVPAADAKIFFDGDSTYLQGIDRSFASPPLDPGRTFSYKIKAEWTENGKKVDRTQDVAVSAGQTATVDFAKEK